jgi:hypothetical protein
MGPYKVVFQDIRKLKRMMALIAGATTPVVRTFFGASFLAVPA